MDIVTLGTLMKQQRRFFASGATLSLEARMDALIRLERTIETFEPLIYEALHEDLGKSEMEGYMCEVGLVLGEIRWMKRHLERLIKPKVVRTPLAHFPAKSYQSPSPLGNVLIMSPWNYPFLLTLEPLVDALAAGNTAVVKPSAYAPATSATLSALLEECFDPAYVAVVIGGRKENQALLEERFDKIFFTGSTTVGRHVMACAAKHLTPVTLELGGKSPCIVEKSCNVRLAARRIVFGKFVNCGQTCVAPDYILCDETIHDELIGAIEDEICVQYGGAPLENKDFGKIVNEKHFKRLMSLIDPAKVVWGGASDAKALKIEPTIMDNVTWDDTVMQEEIFGPILPILTYHAIDDVIETIEARPRPLALYLFTESEEVKQTVLARCRFGGGCVNDTLIHLATSEMPFGGVGESGMGTYHGEAGFMEFSHMRSIVDRKTWTDMDLRYQPYSRTKLRLVKKAM